VLDAVWVFVREMTPGANANSFPLRAVSARPTVTRRQGTSYKLLVASCCLLSLVYEVYWQAVLAQSLMLKRGSNLDELPFDVLERVGVGENVVFNMRSWQYNMVMHDEDRFSRLVQRAAARNDGPRVISDNAAILESVAENGDVLLATWSELLGMVANMSEAECARLQLIRQPLAVPMWHGLILSPALAPDRRHELTALVAERTDYDDSASDELHLSPFCRERLFPTAVTTTAYSDLTLSSMGGAFCAWALVAAVAVVAFGVVHVCARRRRDDETAYDSMSMETIVASLDDVLDGGENVFTFNVENERQRARLLDLLREAQAAIVGIR